MAVASLRKGLVVFQFVISVVLIISSVVIASQMSYMRSKDLGFDKDSQLIIPLRSMNSKNIYASLKMICRTIHRFNLWVLPCITRYIQPF